jgi:hypothetical protein
MTIPKFSVYQMFCNVMIWLLRPLTVPIEMIIHFNVGERYPGFSSLIALIGMGTLAEFCPPNESFLLYVLMAAFIVRIIVHRIWCIFRRVRGGPIVHSRSPGRPLLQLLIPKLPEMVIQWIEPLVVLLGAAVMAAVNETVGDYLMASGAALLGITIVRATAGYNRVLDTLDALIEQEPQVAKPINCLPDTPPTRQLEFQR